MRLRINLLALSTVSVSCRNNHPFLRTFSIGARPCISSLLIRHSNNKIIIRSFYRAANSIFGKIGRITSEEVIIQLIKSKCIPALLYGLEACPLTKSDTGSLDFVINRFFMKLLRILLI